MFQCSRVWSTITKELEVTFRICVPLRVVLPPLGKVMVTVKPDTKPTARNGKYFDSLPLTTGLEGEIDEIDGDESRME